MTRRREARAQLSAAPDGRRDVAPWRLGHWRNVLPEIVLTDSDLYGVEQHLRNNPQESRESALCMARVGRAITLHKRDLREWCRDRDLLDEWGRTPPLSSLKFEPPPPRASASSSRAGKAHRGATKTTNRSKEKS